MSRRLTPLPMIFQSSGALRLELGGRLGDLAVAHRAARRLVGDDAARGRQLADRHAPLLSGGVHQHHARGGTALAHVVDRGPDAAAAAGRHVAPGALLGEVLLGRDVLGLDLGPVALEVLGDQLRQTRQRTLAHLGARDAHRRGVVGMDDDPDADRRAGVADHFLGNRLEDAAGDLPAKRQTAARDRGRGDEMPSIEFHGRLLMPCRCRTRRGWRRGCAGRCRSDRCWSSRR